ncbi:Fe-S oxidoreductase [Lecanora helva]
MDSLDLLVQDLRDGLWLQKILNSWHAYRYLLSVLGILIFVFIYGYNKFHSTRRRLSSSSIIYTPAETPSSEKGTWTEEKLQAKSHGHRPGYITSEENENRRPKQASAAISRPRLQPKRVTGSKVGKVAQTQTQVNRRIQPLIFFSSLTGSTEKRAQNLRKDLQNTLQDKVSVILEPCIYDLSYIDYDDFFVSPPRISDSNDVQYVYLLLLPTYNIDTSLDNFLGHLQDTHHDFRIDTAPLSKLAGYSVFGFGDREGWPTEGQGFCLQAVEVDQWMAKLTGRKRAFPLGLGDVKSDAQARLEEWRDGILKVLIDIADHGNLGEGIMGSGDAVESDEDFDEAEDDGESMRPKPGRRKPKSMKSKIDDLEDLGRKTRKESSDSSPRESSSSPLPIDFTTSSTSISQPQSQPPKAMVPVSSPTHAALTKQGYTIIGTHSGVKICRWTKSALRGRGSCYKYSFYGIKSHLCMETTPSLSCSNKCVFCWRHGTNPVGTTWRWQVDPPDMIFQGAKEGHYKKIKMMRGVPGVRAERFQEAMKIRHCALSLVGEPIFYPHINEFLDLLHKEHISSFLVCNAQHPDQLAALKPVTQLYVSIDASNAESLRKIDRPLHRDYWQRFQRCLDILREKRFRMRTVFRLTLVKGFNIDEEVEGYADLVARGLPCFVEIKGVTYCGTSSSAGAGLTMQNVPFYEEITTFVEALNSALERRGLEYGIAAEHAHSCCVLIASKRFFVERKWHTLIDYEKFFACLEAGEEFSPEDYMGPPTPEWATWGRGGFDPADERVDRKGRPKGGVGAIGDGNGMRA